MDGQSLPPLLRIPFDIRMSIYEYLLDDCGNQKLEIRHRALGQKCQSFRPPAKRRSFYRIIEPSVRRQCATVTYALACDAEMHPAIMAANRRLHSEASWFLYGRHTFSFGADIEAIQPFLGDLTPSTRSLVRSLSLRKGSPFGRGIDPIDWSYMCRNLQDWAPKLERLRIIVEGDMPQSGLCRPRHRSDRGDVGGVGVPWAASDDDRDHVDDSDNDDGHGDENGYDDDNDEDDDEAIQWWKLEQPQSRPLQVSDFRLLCHIKHDSFSWIRDLGWLNRKSSKLALLEVVADVRPASASIDPSATEAILHAAFSLSITTAFVEFLKSDLGLPAVCPT